jgi:putative ABC transport system substrate-binding protein
MASNNSMQRAALRAAADAERPADMRTMRRREFAILLGAAAVLQPRAGRAQQPTIPVVGLLDSSSAAVWPFVAAFRTGPAEAGFIEGRNVGIEYRWADGDYDC